MTKAITRGHGPIRPGLRPGGVEELTVAGPGRTACVNGLLGQGHPSRHRGNGERGPYHTGSFEQSLVRARQALDVRLNELPQTHGDEPCDGFHTTTHIPCLWPALQYLLTRQFVNERDQKQRIAAGALMQEPGQTRRDRRRPEALLADTP